MKYNIIAQSYVNFHLNKKYEYTLLYKDYDYIFVITIYQIYSFLIKTFPFYSFYSFIRFFSIYLIYLIRLTDMCIFWYIIKTEAGTFLYNFPFYLDKKQSNRNLKMKSSKSLSTIESLNIPDTEVEEYIWGRRRIVKLDLPFLKSFATKLI